MYRIFHLPNYWSITEILTMIHNHRKYHNTYISGKTTWFLIYVNVKIRIFFNLSKFYDNIFSHSGT